MESAYGHQSKASSVSPPPAYRQSNPYLSSASPISASQRAPSRRSRTIHRTLRAHRSPSLGGWHKVGNSLAVTSTVGTSTKTTSTWRVTLITAVRLLIKTKGGITHSLLSYGTLIVEPTMKMILAEWRQPTLEKAKKHNDVREAQDMPAMVHLYHDSIKLSQICGPNECP